MNPIKIVYHGNSSANEVYEYLLKGIPQMVAYVIQHGTKDQLRNLFSTLSEGKAYIEMDEFRRKYPDLANKPKYDWDGVNPDNVFDNARWTIVNGKEINEKESNKRSKGDKYGS